MNLFPLILLFSINVAEKFDKAFWEKLNTLKSEDKVSVIVVMRQGYDFSKFKEDDYDGKREYIKRVAYESQKPVIEWLLSTGKAEEIKQFFVVNGFSVRLPKEVILKLAEREDIAYIEEDKYVRLIPEKSQNYTLATYPTDETEVPWDRKIMNADKVWKELGYRGEGIVIGIMDSGVDVEHPALKDNWRAIAGWYDAINGRNYPYDDNMHGTACASIMAGKFNLGIAPQAKFIACKILDSGGGGTITQILSGFNWIAGLPDSLKPRVVSNSWGIDSWADTTFFRSCSTWKALGIFPIFAAGNNSSAPDSQSVPGTYPIVLSVGATDPYDEITSYSARGGAPNLARWNNTYNWYAPDWNRHKPDVCAPADPVVAAYPGGSYISDFNGTSSATPHVAGEAALILSRNPYLSLSQLYLTIRNNTKLIQPARYDYPNDTTGWGRVDAYRAVVNTPLPQAPNIVIKALEIDDRRGNSDGYLQPGEQVTLNVILLNRGSYASSVTASLVFDTIPLYPHYVTYNVRTSTLGSMASGEEKIAQFDVTLSSDAPYDKYLYFTLKISTGSTSMYRFFHIPITTTIYPARTDTLRFDNNSPYYNTSNDNQYANYSYFASRFETTAPCSLKAIQVYFDGTATSETLFVWKHNAAYNSPDAELFGYAIINVATADQWTTVTLPSPIYISNPGYFWVGIRKSSTTAVPYQDNDGASTVNLSTNNRTNPSSWWGADYWYDFCWRPIVKTVEATTPLIMEVTSYRIDDSFYGNNNGIIDPGERVALRVSVKNIGITADSAIGYLLPVGSTADSVTIIKEQAYFGTIYQGEGGNNDSDPFIIQFTNLSGLSGFDPEFQLILHYRYGDELREEKEDTVSFKITGPFITQPGVYYWYAMGLSGGVLLPSYPTGTYYWATFAPFGYSETDSIYVDSVAIYGYNDATTTRNLYLYLWSHNFTTGRPNSAPFYTSAAISVPRNGSQFYFVRPNRKIPSIFWYGQNQSTGVTGTGLKPPLWYSPFIGTYTLINTSTSDWSNPPFYIELPLFQYFKIRHDHPTLSYYTPSGWDSPVVPSNTNFTTLPSILKGDTTVYISGWVALNRSNVTASIPSGKTLRNIMFLDNYGLAQVTLSGPQTIGGWSYIYYTGYVDTIPAGRHTLYYAIDWDNVVPSNIFNHYLRYWGEQYVFMPIGYLNYNTLYSGGPAPDMTGPGAGYRFNHISYRTRTITNQWIAVAMKNRRFDQSGDSIDLDLRIYEDAPTSPREGLENASAFSSLGPDRIEFIAVWGKEAKDIYPAVYSFGEVRDSFSVLVTKSVFGYLTYGGSSRVDVALPSSNFAYIENIIVPGGVKANITVDVPTGDADIALYLFSRNTKVDEYRNPVEYVAYSDASGPGGSETVSYSPTTTDTVGLLILKKSGSQDYSIRFNNIVILPVEDNMNNSLNTIYYKIPSILKTTSAIEVNSPTVLPLTIKLFDVQGRYMATVFEGLTEKGTRSYRLPQGIKPGVYFIEVTSGENKKIHKTVIVK
ncbi:MAG: S8 family serine peptidase [Candidatus Hydrothermia bacterium]